MTQAVDGGLSITVFGNRRINIPKDTQFVIVKKQDGSLDFTGKGSQFKISWCGYPNSADEPLDPEVYAQELKRLGYGVEVRLQS